MSFLIGQYRVSAEALIGRKTCCKLMGLCVWWWNKPQKRLCINWISFCFLSCVYRRSKPSWKGQNPPSQFIKEIYSINAIWRVTTCVKPLITMVDILIKKLFWYYGFWYPDEVLSNVLGWYNQILHNCYLFYTFWFMKIL